MGQSVKPFNNPEVITQSWYVVGRSSALKPGQVVSANLLRRRIAVYRGKSGRVFALDGRCAHLGAHLGDGAVVDDSLACPFHGWTYSGDGKCVHIPYRDSIPSTARTFSYPTEERYGAVWVFNGPKPTFPIPDFADEDGWRVVRLPPQTLQCHPHVIVPNALDVTHWRAVHGVELIEESGVEALDAFRLRARWVISVRRGASRLFRLLRVRRIAATYTTWGGNMATAEVEEPWRLRALFTHRPLIGGRSASQTFVFLPKGRRPLDWLGLWWVQFAIKILPLLQILRDDRKILDHLDFWPNMTEEDVALAEFIRQVNDMEIFDAASHDLVD